MLHAQTLLTAFWIEEEPSAGLRGFSKASTTDGMKSASTRAAEKAIFLAIWRGNN